MKHVMKLDEGQRQMMLMALAHLAVERPGWDDALQRLAIQLDNEQDGRPQMYDQFRKMHRTSLVAARSGTSGVGGAGGGSNPGGVSFASTIGGVGGAGGSNGSFGKGG